MKAIDLYEAARLTPSDINEHIPALRLLSAMTEHGVVVELGVRYGTSGVALLCGQPRQYIGYDVAFDYTTLSDVAKDFGASYVYRKKNTLGETDPPWCDLLFVDTVHTAAQVREELRIFAPRTGVFIAFHDTESYGEVGEDGGPGVNFAIRDFLADNLEWKTLVRFTNNNGLWILRKVG